MRDSYSRQPDESNQSVTTSRRQVLKSTGAFSSGVVGISSASGNAAADDGDDPDLKRTKLSGYEEIRYRLITSQNGVRKRLFCEIRKYTGAINPGTPDVYRYQKGDEETVIVEYQPEQVGRDTQEDFPATGDIEVALVVRNGSLQFANALVVRSEVESPFPDDDDKGDTFIQLSLTNDELSRNVGFRSDGGTVKIPKQGDDSQSDGVSTQVTCADCSVGTPCYSVCRSTYNAVCNNRSRYCGWNGVAVCIVLGYGNRGAGILCSILSHEFCSNSKYCTRGAKRYCTSDDLQEVCDDPRLL